MKALLLLTTLLLGVVMCRARVPFSTSACQEVKSPVCTADIGVSFFPHETDCAIFYVCNNGRLSTYACPHGQYFYDQGDLCVSSRYVRCDRCASNKARCGECGCGETTTPPPCEPTFQPTTERVTPNEPTTERVTPNEPTTERVTPNKSTTERATTVESTVTDTTEPLTTTPEQTTTSDAISEESTATTDTTSGLPFCPPNPTCSEEEMGAAKPYPPDCTSYIYCSSSSVVIRKCKTGLEFNPTSLRCVEASLANCPLCISNY